MALLITDIGLLATCAGPLTQDPRERLGLLRDAAVLCEGDRIVWLGPQNQLPTLRGSFDRISAQGQLVGPGFVDAHTHLVFAGDRSAEEARG